MLAIISYDCRRNIWGKVDASNDFFLFAEVPRNDTCPELPEISNGWKSTSHPDLVHGTVVTYQCYPGFEVVGTEMLMCQWDLTWSGDLPSCERGENTYTHIHDDNHSL